MAQRLSRVIKSDPGKVTTSSALSYNIWTAVSFEETAAAGSSEIVWGPSQGRKVPPAGPVSSIPISHPRDRAPMVWAAMQA